MIFNLGWLGMTSITKVKTGECDNTSVEERAIVHVTQISMDLEWE